MERIPWQYRPLPVLADTSDRTVKHFQNTRPEFAPERDDDTVMGSNLYRCKYHIVVIISNTTTGVPFNRKVTVLVPVRRSAFSDMRAAQIRLPAMFPANPIILKSYR